MHKVFVRFQRADVCGWHWFLFLIVSASHGTATCAHTVPSCQSVRAALTKGHRQTGLLLTFLQAGGAGSGGLWGPGRGRLLSVLTWWMVDGSRKLSGVSYKRGLIPFLGTHPHGLIASKGPQAAQQVLLDAVPAAEKSSLAPFTFFHQSGRWKPVIHTARSSARPEDSQNFISLMCSPVC